MRNATTTDAPSEGLRASISDLTDDGFELEEKLSAFLASVRKAGQDFDAEFRHLDDSDERYQSAAIESAWARSTPSRSTCSTSSPTSCGSTSPTATANSTRSARHESPCPAAPALP
jgi:hypothetical protein